MKFIILIIEDFFKGINQSFQFNNIKKGVVSSDIYVLKISWCQTF